MPKTNNSNNNSNNNTNNKVNNNAIKTIIKKDRNVMKPKLTVVRRCFYDDRLNLPKNSTAVPRLTCIVYDENRLTGEVRFGASFYRRDAGVSHECKSAIKAQLRETATGRLERRPGTLICKTNNMMLLHQNIRKQLYRTKFDTHNNSNANINNQMKSQN